MSKINVDKLPKSLYNIIYTLRKGKQKENKMRLKFETYIDLTDKEYAEVLAKKQNIFEKTGESLKIDHMVISLGLAQCLDEETYDYSL